MSVTESSVTDLLIRSNYRNYRSIALSENTIQNTQEFHQVKNLVFITEVHKA